ncbi:leucine carboxyl methyltransferase 1-like [Oscarella lobularis]|uniref:leucine carboxyl methyltransferase 1-like n=1 Tax=Oscarella lobularis TaxID=121494 RepID=UPI0033131B21
MADGVAATNEDATACKRFAVDKGYWDDPFIASLSRPAQRKSPEISRGYYARIKAIETLVLRFLSRAGRAEAQIISLGAGFDTLYWRLCANEREPRLYVEIDVPSVARRKQAYCQSKANLGSVLRGSVSVDALGLHSSGYHLVGVDITDVETLEKVVASLEISRELPTLILAECVLVYLEPARSRRLIAWAGQYFSVTSIFINYGPVNVCDRFGRVMVENLRMRRAAFLGADDCTDLEKQREVFVECGWEESRSVDMLEVYGTLPQEDVQRIERLEFLDERELLEQLLQHYSVSWAIRDVTKIGLSEIQI